MKGTGLIFKLPDDPRDVYTSQYIEFGSSRLKDKYYGAKLKDIRKLKVEDQKWHGSCVGQTVGKIKEYYEKKHLSHRYIYVLTDKIYEHSNKRGLQPKNAFRFMRDIGTVQEKYCPDDNFLREKDYYNGVHMLNGVKHYKNSGYSFVPRGDVEELKKAFKKHEVLLLAVSKGRFQKSGKLTSNGRSNHAVMAFGVERQEDGKHKVYFLNSWGEDWGDRGVGWFIFEDYKKPFYFMASDNVPEEVIKYNKEKYKTIRYGSVGEAVKIAQRLLHITADGIFGKQTLRAVRMFQVRHGLVPDGIVGKKTWNALLNQ